MDETEDSDEAHTSCLPSTFPRHVYEYDDPEDPPETTRATAAATMSSSTLKKDPFDILQPGGPLAHKVSLEPSIYVRLISQNPVKLLFIL